MPDLDVVAFWCCESVISDEKEVLGSDGDTKYLVRWESAPRSHPYSMWWRCYGPVGSDKPCWPWNKNKTCKHAKEAERQHCGWDTGPGIGDAGEPVEVIMHIGLLDGVEVWRTQHASQAIIWRDNGRADLRVEQEVEKRCPRCGGPVTAQRWGV